MKQSRKACECDSNGNGAVSMVVAGDWKVLVEGVRDDMKIVSVVAVPPPDIITVNAEMHERMPAYDPKCWSGWGRGITLREILSLIHI